MTADLRHSPLEHLAAALASASTDAVRLRQLPYLSQMNLRVDPSTVAARRIGTAFGVPLPTRPNTVAVASARAVLWLGPDEWLVLGQDGDAPAIETLLRDALGCDHGSVVDVSADRTTIELSGPSAREVLEKGCPIDLYPRLFGPGQCAQTLLARAQVILRQVDHTPTYHILVRASFAPYLAEWLLDAIGEFRHLAVSR